MKYIKYRIWEEKDGDMIYSNTDEPITLENTSLKADFMPFLDIYDIKQREIYNHDIVKNLNTDEISEVWIENIVIDYFQKHIMVKTIVLKDLKTKCRKPMDIFNETYEVIGNKYQTKELYNK